jgi:hypothetical protein
VICILIWDWDWSSEYIMMGEEVYRADDLDGCVLR